jgi:hypothetical protein
MATKTRKRKKPDPAEPVDAADLGRRAATEPHKLGLDTAQEALQKVADAVGGEVTAQGFNADGEPVGPAIKVAPAPDSPDRLAEWDKKTVRMVNTSAKECAELKADYEIKAEVAKEAKKKYDLAVADHFDLIRTRREGRGKPEQKELFDKAEGHAAAQDDQRTPAEVLAAGPGDDDAWKAEPTMVLVPLGLKLRYAQALGAQHGLDTLGKLNAFTEPSASGWVNKYEDLKGIGPKGAEQIADAFAKFWETWPETKAARDASAETPE